MEPSDDNPPGTPPEKLPRFPRAFIRIEESSTIPCFSDRSPTGMHFFAMCEGMGGKRACRFCGTKEIEATLISSPSNEAGKSNPTPVQSREVHEVPVSREQAESIASQLTGRRCWTARRRIGKRKIRVLYVDQGESARALMFEASDWWLALRALHAFLKNRGELPPEGSDEGGMLVTA